MAYSPHEIEWTPEKAARLWDYYATNASIRSQYFGLQAGPAVAALIDRVADIGSLGQILDMSCGHGDVLDACRPYLGKQGRLTGIDFSAKTVVAAAERFRGVEPPVEIRHVASFPSELRAASFDLVIVTEVVEHLDDHELNALLEECSRLLAPEGWLAITTPNDEDYDAAKVCCPDCGCVFHRWQHRRTWNATSLRQSIEAHGFVTTLATPIAWQTVELRQRPLWRRIARRLLARFRTPPAQTGLVYIGRKAA